MIAVNRVMLLSIRYCSRRHDTRTLNKVNRVLYQPLVFYFLKFVNGTREILSGLQSVYKAIKG